MKNSFLIRTLTKINYKALTTIGIVLVVSLGVPWTVNPQETSSLLKSDPPTQKREEPEKDFQKLSNYAIAYNLAKKPLGEVMQAIAQRLLGSQYKAGLLDKTKQETLVISFTQFDCLLFVETVLALARNIVQQDYNYSTFTNHIIDQRYRHGKLNGYCSRLHYFSEWIEDNQKRGNVKNITTALGGVPLKKTLNFMSTHRQAYAQLKSDDNYQCIVQMEKNLESLKLSYIPQPQIKSIYSRLQPGDIIGVVTNIAGLDVTHTGLVYRTTEGNIGFIHASPAGKVTIATDLQNYVGNVKNAIGIFVARPVLR